MTRRGSTPPASDRNADHLSARARNLDAARDRALALDRTLDRALALDRTLDLALNRARARELTHALDRVVDLDLARDLAHALDRDLTFTLARDLDRARDLALDLKRILTLVAVQDRANLDGAAAEDVVAWRPAGRCSVRLTRWAARLLPPHDQSLYRELYLSELTELAQDPHPHRTQVAYTIQVLTGVLPLRRALRAPTPAIRQRTW